MLGTNDFQSMHQLNAWHSAQGIAAIINAIHRTPLEPGMPTPDILVVSPPTTQKAKGSMAKKFAGAETKAEGLAQAIKQVAFDNHCHFFDAGSVVTTSQVDGVHLDEEQHLALGKALAKVVRELLANL